MEPMLHQATGRVSRSRPAFMWHRSVGRYCTDGKDSKKEDTPYVSLHERLQAILSNEKSRHEKRVVADKNAQLRARSSGYMYTDGKPIKHHVTQPVSIEPSPEEMNLESDFDTVSSHILNDPFQKKVKDLMEKLGTTTYTELKEDDLDPTANIHLGTEVPLEDDSNAPYNLSEDEIYALARRRVQEVHGDNPSIRHAREIDNEVQRIKSMRPDAISREFYASMRQLAKDKPRPMGHPRQRGICQLSGPSAPKITYQNVNLLSQYLTQGGQIKPARVTGVSAKKQRELARAVKRSR